MSLAPLRSLTRGAALPALALVGGLSLLAPSASALTAGDVDPVVQFTYTGPIGMGGDDARAGDFNGDGHTDLMYNNNGFIVALNSGDGQNFTTTKQGAGKKTWGLDVGDLDGDGDIDAVSMVFDSSLAWAEQFYLEIYANDGAGTFTLTSSFHPSERPAIGDEQMNPVLFGDFDGDGDLDLAAALGRHVDFYRNDGLGNLTLYHVMDPIPALYWDFARSLRLGDMNGDGVDDLVMFCWNNGVVVAVGDGAGNFTPGSRHIPTAGGFTWLYEDGKLADVDGDLDLDVLTEEKHSGTGNQVWLNNGDGTLTHAGHIDANLDPNNQLIAADFDGDGDADVISEGKIYESNGDGTFTFFDYVRKGANPWNDKPLATADLDGDGLVEVIYNNHRQATNALPTSGGPVDSDGDGVADDADPCTGFPNDDTDSDGVCDTSDTCPTDPADIDGDGDGVCDVVDLCIGFVNADSDGDQICDDWDLCLGNDATGDTDSDGICDASDNCPSDVNPGQEDFDGDLLGDACDADSDGDGTDEVDDNCPGLPNPDQANSDGDLQGDACDADDDNDGVADGTDNCPVIPNADQADFDGDLQGDACDGDDDADGVADDDDLCPGTPLDVTWDPSTGCSGVQWVEFEAPCGGSWANHGKYQSAVVKAANTAVAKGLLTTGERAAIVRTAAKSSCGK